MFLPHLTKHAKKRMQQRVIPPLIIQWLEQYGTIKHDGRGADIIFFDRNAKRKVSEVAGQRVVDLLGHLMDVYMVVSQDGSLITCGHHYKKFKFN